MARIQLVLGYILHTQISHKPEVQFQLNNIICGLLPALTNRLRAQCNGTPMKVR